MSIKKGWKLGWILGGKLEKIGRKPKVKKVNSSDKELMSLISEVNETFVSTESLSSLDPFRMSAAIAVQAAHGVGLPPDNSLVDSMMLVVEKYGEYEGLYGINEDVSIPETHAGKAELKKALRENLVKYKNEEEVLHVFVHFLMAVFERIYTSLPSVCVSDVSKKISGTTFDSHILNLFDDVYEVVESICVEFYHDDLKDVGLFNKTREILQVNGQLAAGINPSDPANYGKPFPFPTDSRNVEPDIMVKSFLRNTPLSDIFFQKLPFHIPEEIRMEHTHVLAGSGHGKTQLLQKLVLDDLESNTGFCIIDSQGDLISKLLLNERMSPSRNPKIFDRLVLIDASDVEYPTCLNLFSLNKDKEKLSFKDKEILVNSTIDLYTYIFTSLLGAELTARQGTIFVYISKLIMEIPDASIITLRKLMENGKQFQPYMDRLDGSAKAFFQTQFFSKAFEQTKKQILYRLWSVLSNATLERMFSNTENKIDLFDAMNQGKIVLINTSKQVLGQIGSEVMGKFFIAMLTQSAIKRSAINESDRRPFHVYIDEAYEYVDNQFNQFINQTRKYKVGFHLFHQNYDQLPNTVRSSILSSTSIKFAGGVSTKDARTLAEEMKTTTDRILSAKKYKTHSEFNLFVRNETSNAISIDVPLGLLENEPTMSMSSYEQLIKNNRERYCKHISKIQISEPNKSFDDFDRKEETLKRDLVSSAGEIIERKESLEKDIELSESVEKTFKPQEPNRGGVRHKYLQGLIQKLANEKGFIAEPECVVNSGDGYVDVVLKREGLKIACEVSVTTPSNYEIKNIQKCLDDGYEIIWMVCADAQHLKEVYSLAQESFSEYDFKKVTFLNDELLDKEFKKYIFSEDSKKNKSHGYDVNVSFIKPTVEEQKAKQDAISKILIASKG